MLQRFLEFVDAEIGAPPPPAARLSPLPSTPPTQAPSPGPVAAPSPRAALDAVNELLRTFEVPVVFITAYPERFLTGERPEPAFLISKPFQPAMVSAVASQALFFQLNSRNRTPRVA